MPETLKKFQELLRYKFKNEHLLAQALTTPQFGNENKIPSYEYLEILGDSVIKTAFILKLYQMGINDPGEITQLKASLENDEVFKKVAMEIDLEQYIFKSDKQKIDGTRILADIFEAICGAIFLDSDFNIKLVEDKIINRFYTDIESIIKDSTTFNKNALLEFLQNKYKTNIFIKLKFEKYGLEHDPIWRAKKPKIIDKNTQKELLILPNNFQSEKFGNKKDAEKDLYLKILNFIKKKELE
ncbi:MAG: ribonuclease III domain-containing protein [Candidatus Hodarchaeota archaeon]